MGGVAAVADKLGLEDTPVGDILEGATDFVHSAGTGGLSDAVRAYDEYQSGDATGIEALGNFLDEAIDPGDSVDTLAKATRDIPSSQADKEEQQKWAKNVEVGIGAAGNLVGGPIVGAPAVGFTSKIAGEPSYIGQIKSALTAGGFYGGQVIGAGVGDVAKEAGIGGDALKYISNAGGAIGGSALKTGTAAIANAALNSGTASLSPKSAIENPSDVDTSQTATSQVASNAVNDTEKQLKNYGVTRGAIGTGTMYNPKIGRMVGGYRIAA